jgi:uncharacterized membrane protein YraQ (UPF0718 family)
MYRVQKLPFILGASMSIITGLICYYTKLELKDTYIRMMLSLIIFFIIGVFARKSIVKIKVEVDDKLKADELERLQMEAKEKLELKRQEELENKGSIIDLEVSDDDFITDDLTRAVHSQLEEDGK